VFLKSSVKREPQLENLQNSPSRTLVSTLNKLLSCHKTTLFQNSEFIFYIQVMPFIIFLNNKKIKKIKDLKEKVSHAII